MKKIITRGVKIYTFEQNKTDYISLTDIARYKNAIEPKDVEKIGCGIGALLSFLVFGNK